MSNINILEIKKEITNRHNEFLKEFSSQIDKVVSDHRLLSEITITKLKYILNAFVEAGIIDGIEDIDYKPYKKLRLFKKDSDNSIYIITNGKSITLEGHNYAVLSGEFKNIRVGFNDVQDEDYEWKNFYLQLLDYIHAVIYERKEACEAKIDGMFNRKKK